MNSNCKNWIDVLKSGKYKQCKKVLHDMEDNSFCCLGVACDLYINSPEGKENNARWESYGVFASEEGYERAMLPREVSEWLGIKEYGNQIKLGDNVYITNYNDGFYGLTITIEPESFSQIAKRLENLFER